MASATRLGKRTLSLSFEKYFFLSEQEGGGGGLVVLRIQEKTRVAAVDVGSTRPIIDIPCLTIPVY